MNRPSTLLIAVSIALIPLGPVRAQGTQGTQDSPGAANSSSVEWTRTPPEVSGFLQVHYRNAFATGSDSLVDNDDFRVQRVRIGVSGPILPWLSYDIEVDPRAPEIAGVLRDAFIALKIIPRHRLRIGQQKMPFGYENQESSSRLYAVNRTELSDNLSRGINLRDIGVGLSGNLPLDESLRIEDAIAVSNGAGMNVQADDTPTKNLWGRLGLRHKSGDNVARLGLSGGMGDFIDVEIPEDPDDDIQVEFTRVGADVEIDRERYFFSAEYAVGWEDNVTTGESDDPRGYYINWVGKTPWRVGPIVRLDTLGDEYKRWTIGGYYGLSAELFRVMVNYEYRQLKDDLRADDKLYTWVQVRF